MRIVFLSGCAAALPSLQLLHQTGHTLTLLCPAVAEGRSAHSERTQLEAWAHTEQLPCWQVGAGELDQDLSELIRETSPDLVLAFGFSATINPMLLEPLRHGGWNVHFSLRPAPGNGEFEGCIFLHDWRGDHCSDLLLQRRCGIPIDHEKPMDELAREAALLLEDALLQAAGLPHILGWPNVAL
ncbi:MAG: hypothetical protein EOO15_05185 [Chitinophagaceae bacterium]|nr:MAG: hypothetical protein EOO15_05185 [Chitinophagaceae bacterium]